MCDVPGCHGRMKLIRSVSLSLSLLSRSHSLALTLSLLYSLSIDSLTHSLATSSIFSLSPSPAKLRHVSFVDCPGHDILMATMLSGAAVMDAALLLIAGNEPCPQPQTSEHLAAIEIMKLKHIIVLQNKVDLISESAAEEQYHTILNFVKGV